MKKQLVTGMILAFSGAFFVTSANAAVDEAAAKALAKSSDCLKCHAPDKDKKGPSWKKIAAKYKGKADGEDKVVKFMTTSPMVKLDDGKEEKHAAADSKDAGAVKNLAGWILSN